MRRACRKVAGNLLRHVPRLEGMVQPGMTIAEDVRTHLGTLLIARGFEVSLPFLERLRNLGASVLSEQVKVLAPASTAAQ